MAQAGSAAHPTAHDLNGLRREAAGCQACELWKLGTQTVFGEGTADARVMLVGEQPGDQEDLQGQPFVGPAGKVLDTALEESGLDRGEVYVTNAVKANAIVLLGATAASSVLGPRFRLSEHRGEFVETSLDALVTATVHPSSILRARDAAERQAGMEGLVRDLSLVAQATRR
jgi:uracil-DNA glycosylase